MRDRIWFWLRSLGGLSKKNPCARSTSVQGIAGVWSTPSAFFEGISRSPVADVDSATVAVFVIVVVTKISMRVSFGQAVKMRVLLLFRCQAAMSATPSSLQMGCDELDVPTWIVNQMCARPGLDPIFASLGQFLFSMKTVSTGRIFQRRVVRARSEHMHR